MSVVPSMRDFVILSFSHTSKFQKKNSSRSLYNIILFASPEGLDSVRTASTFYYLLKTFSKSILNKGCQKCLNVKMLHGFNPLFSFVTPRVSVGRFLVEIKRKLKRYLKILFT